MSRSGPAHCAALLVAAPTILEARVLRGAAPDVRVTRTGMGPARSRRAAKKLRDEPACALAVAGLCGALDDGLLPADLFVATELLGGDADPVELASGPVLEALERAGLRAASGPLVSRDHAVHGALRSELARCGARAVDMESAWLAEGAAGRPFAVLRAVMDSPEHELFRPSAIAGLLRALRALRRAMPALAGWARAASREPEVCVGAR